MFLVIAFILFVLLIVVHEYGHFLVAKRNGVEAEEFGIGFPPKIAGKKMGKGIFEGYYTINWLPLGGFVRLKGETDADKRKGSYGAASFWVKTKIILAGVIMNFLTAILLFTILAWVGMPELIPNQFSVASDKTNVSDDVRIAVVEPESPAQAAGIRPGDDIVSFADTEISDAEQINGELTEQYHGQTVNVRYERNGEIISSDVEIRTDEELEELNRSRSEDEQLVGNFGVYAADVITDRYSWSAPLVGIGTTAQIAGETYAGLADLISNLFKGNTAEATSGVAGPLGIVLIFSNLDIFGYSFLLGFIAVISLSLAIMNSLPIPALDGGRLALSGAFKLMDKPLTAELEQKINNIGFTFLLLLILLITIVDIDRVFG